ncbi:MAG: hypothetical protein R3D44_13385 [Hyphomicrobiaceae bacterium]
MMHDWGFSHGWGFGWGSYGPIGMVIVALIVIWPFWRICEKAGYPGVTALLSVIPLVNVVFLYWLAFSDWPSQRRNPPEPANGRTVR